MDKEPDITVITPNRNGGRYLEAALNSVVSQRSAGLRLEYIVIDGDSTDNSPDIFDQYRADIDQLIVEPDDGAAAAINKGLKLARGRIIGWLNSDDFYYPGTLMRVVEAMSLHPAHALGFGGCRIVNEQDQEIRKGITLFKELFYPISSRFTIQSINYISQPAMFFRRAALNEAGLLREDMKAAWDYELILRLWRQGGGFRIQGPPLSAFRWHSASISGQHFRRQFREEYEVAVADAGRYSLQAFLHWGVRWGIVGAYSCMAWRRRSHA